MWNRHQHTQRRYVSHPCRIPDVSELARTGTDLLIADIHVVVVVGAVGLYLVGPGRAVAFGGLRRQRRVVGVLPLLPLLLAVITLLFFIVISGDLRGDGGFNTLRENPDSAIAVRPHLDVSLLALCFLLSLPLSLPFPLPLPLLVFVLVLLLLAAGLLALFAARIFVSLAVSFPFLILLLLLLVSAGGKMKPVRPKRDSNETLCGVTGEQKPDPREHGGATHLRGDGVLECFLLGDLLML